MDATDLFRLLHSILRWLVFFSVATAGLVALRGYLRGAPIIVWERTLTIVAMILCHVQLFLGLLLYALQFKSYTILSKIGNQTANTQNSIDYWRMVHPMLMILVIALVTIGRMSSKKAKTERRKQLLVAIFFLLALALMVYAIPWPGTRMGQGRGWI